MFKEVNMKREVVVTLFFKKRTCLKLSIRNYQPHANPTSKKVSAHTSQMTIRKKSTNYKFCRAFRELCTFQLLVGCKLVTALMKTEWSCFERLKLSHHMMRPGTFSAYNLRPPESERQRQENMHCSNIEIAKTGKQKKGP